MAANFLPAILKRFKDQHLVSVEQMAEWGEREVQTMYGYMGGKDMPYSVLRRIARRAADDYGFTGFGADLLGTRFDPCPRGTTKADGSLLDEHAEQTLAIADQLRSFAEGNTPAYDAAIMREREILQRKIAEGARLPR